MRSDPSESDISPPVGRSFIPPRGSLFVQVPVGLPRAEQCYPRRNFGALLFTTVVALVQWLYLLGKPFYQKPSPWLVPAFIGSMIALASGLTGLTVLQFRANRRLR